MNFPTSSTLVLVGLRLGAPLMHGDTNRPPAVLHPRVTGCVEHLAPMDSQFVDRRNVGVWLPPGYFSGEAKARRYPAISYQDGQHIFAPATSFIGVDWSIDETMTRLIAGKQIPEIIVVAIWNTPKRFVRGNGLSRGKGAGGMMRSGTVPATALVGRWRSRNR